MLSLKVLVIASQMVVPVGEFDAMDEPIWCAETNGLIAQIKRLGGQAVKRRYLDDGRTIEWFWSTRDEVILEHNPAGNSCLVRMTTTDR